MSIKKLENYNIHGYYFFAKLSSNIAIFKNFTCRYFKKINPSNLRFCLTELQAAAINCIEIIALFAADLAYSVYSQNISLCTEFCILGFLSFLLFSHKVKRVDDASCHLLFLWRTHTCVRTINHQQASIRVFVKKKKKTNRFVDDFLY